MDASQPIAAFGSDYRIGAYFKERELFLNLA